MNKFVFIYGFALFGMFFGAGNLVFPLKIGLDVGAAWKYGALGLVITGIILPFLGLFVVKLHKGDYDTVFAGAGNTAKHALPFFMLALMGSFAGIPRCITVAYGGIGNLFPGLSLPVFSAMFCIAAFIVGLRGQRLIDVVGKWLTPILLVLLIALITLGALQAREFQLQNHLDGLAAFHNGIMTGYQTMDLLAAFFFSAFIFTHIQKTMPKGTSDKDAFVTALKSSLLAAFLLAIVYLCMVFLGANFSNIIANMQPSMMLIIIANHVIGDYAAGFVGITILFACFTTVVALNNIYAQYLHGLFRLKSYRFNLMLAGTTLTSMFFSLFDFNGITRFLVPLLEIAYPSIIALTIVGIFTKQHYLLKKILFYGILAMSLFYKM
ncbi:MAG: branched-chain amino acid transport system II carrier protein [Holosporaceae bacterium]|jgi:LIVCS family branched-chain amino acid:cation transporter|nr:branched-chain amino acid transport system II carrier protein [Holosporaceae bacterium]